jgi:glutamyl-Q tRNA(Asp) synthetase
MSIRPEETVGRFAPSPTGPLHLGSLVAALGSYLLAKGGGGRWLLRMEDLDQPRVVPGMADDILRTLEILGLCWDGTVLYQSQRTELYQEAFARLEAKGLVYPCGCSRAEIAQVASAPHHAGDELPYPGTCRFGQSPGRAARSYRLRVGEPAIVFVDGVAGTYRQQLAAVCGDFVIKRADGPYAYHLAVVVDDQLSGVTQVVRGADLISSTPRQIYLQQLLGYPQPYYWHLPLVTGPAGAKLSKRDNAVSLAQGRDLAGEGTSLLLAALRFLGQSPPPFPPAVPPRELLAWATAHFDPTLIPTRGGPLILPGQEDQP